MNQKIQRGAPKIKIGLAAAQQWFPHYDPADFCSLMAGWGCDFVEVMPAAAPPEQEDAWFDAVKDSSLELVFHAPYTRPYRLGDFNRPGQKDLFHSMFERLADISRYQQVTRVVQHSAAGPEAMDKGELFSVTGDFLKWFFETRTREGWPLELALELLPHDERYQKVGDCISDLLTLREMFPSYRLIFCWDLGHFRSNLTTGYDGPAVSSFLKDVRHVHAHDMVDGADHHPLVTGEVPVGEYLELLDFEDTIYIGLEIHYENAVSLGEPLELAYSSIRKVAGYTAALQEKPLSARK
ncbi:MAG: sugar phosphate isomerase/epimerase [Chloroflexi bacterium]|nr:sugar phosphate isomerase/epimerase [Chloroflexota bacterium]